MQTAEDQITAQQAKALLDRDTLNRTTRVATKGGTLTEPDRRRLRMIVRNHKERKPATREEKKGQVVTLDPKTFEGTFEQRRRRRKVYLLRMKNYSMREMAAELGASKNAIENDLKEIDKALKAQLDPAHAIEIINETLSDLSSIEALALAEYETAEGNHKNGYLNTYLSARDLKIKLLQDGGTLPKIGRKLELTGKDGVALPPATIVQPVINVVLEHTEETTELARLHNGRR